MGVFVSMGGFIFGYDTGQISGFLGMRDFQERFGQRNSNGDGGFHFSNVRSGLIVALVCAPNEEHHVYRDINTRVAFRGHIDGSLYVFLHIHLVLHASIYPANIERLIVSNNP
jgi:hypothetical protein